MTVIPREKLLGDTVHPNPHLTLLGKSLGSARKSSQRKSRTHGSVVIPALVTGKARFSAQVPCACYPLELALQITVSPMTWCWA